MDDKDKSLWDSFIKEVVPFHSNIVPYVKKSNTDYVYHSTNEINSLSYVKKYIDRTEADNVNYCNISYSTISQGMFSRIDRKSKTKVDRGKYPLAGYLDLHGFTMNDASKLLIDFIINHYNLGSKCLLVITGCGFKDSSRGVIRNNFYKWLQSKEVVKLVLYYTQAIANHGGKGAFYILLKTNRER